jgi:hypothetical protein
LDIHLLRRGSYAGIIPEDIVLDGDMDEPIIGQQLSRLGVRIATPSEDQSDNTVVLQGKVIWSRIDGDLVERIIGCGDMRVSHESSVIDKAALEVGAEVSLSGTLYGIRDYVFDDFELPDIRQDWLIHSTERENNYYVVDAEPVEFRSNN